ncbi:hypothetical protein GCM10027027_03940 [Neomicrococcus lactis]
MEIGTGVVTAADSTMDPLEVLLEVLAGVHPVKRKALIATPQLVKRAARVVSFRARLRRLAG